jgi:hypothetical protein
VTSDDPHYVLGMIVLLSVVEVALGGIFARSRMVRLKWRTSLILAVKYIHKMFGYALIILSHITILFGTFLYNKNIGTNI